MIRSIRIETVIGDLTNERTDAIVNAANSALVRGGGVCGAIFAKAGPELDAFCARMGGCPTGEARLTPAFGIPIKGIVHAVGPRYGYEGGREAELLGSAWRNSILLADDADYVSIAFPSISTGIYGFPVEHAAMVVAATLATFASARQGAPGSVELVRLVLRDEATKAVYDQAIEAAQRRT
jgi:O-acetyl-ADP-ribose deacetylase (regulator of RNase III)